MLNPKSAHRRHFLSGVDAILQIAQDYSITRTKLVWERDNCAYWINSSWRRLNAHYGCSSHNKIWRWLIGPFRFTMFFVKQGCWKNMVLVHKQLKLDFGNTLPKLSSKYVTYRRADAHNPVLNSRNWILAQSLFTIQTFRSLLQYSQPYQILCKHFNVEGVFRRVLVFLPKLDHERNN